jgi:alpha-tubulin suppressor-like RCC1 family protein
LLSAVGCREDAQSPIAPEPEAALDITPAAALSFRQVSAGGLFTCGLATDDRIYCWGVNGFGQLGQGSDTGPETCPFDAPCSTRPVAVIGGLRFRRVSTGFAHGCGVTTDFRAYCWGYNQFGQLGDGSGSFNNPTPVRVAGGVRFRTLGPGQNHTCGVTYPDNRAYCWGDNTYGQLGDGTQTSRLTPVAVAGGRQFRQVSSGTAHTCGVTMSNEAFCWGSNLKGQVGDSSTAKRRVRPVRVSGGRSYRQLDAGQDHTCAVTTTDRAYCWGDGRNGQLGNGQTYLSFWPRRVSGGLSLERVTAGSVHSCGKTTNDRAYCWGQDGSGQLGDGTNSDRLRPAAVAGGLFFAQVSAGAINNSGHTCGKATDNHAYCWGRNHFGQLGDGTLSDRSTPTPVGGP